MTINQEDIARAVGISPTTVSFVLNGRAKAMNISQTTIDRVIKASNELGYVGNYHARSLSTGDSKTLGLVVSNNVNGWLNRFWMPVIVGIGCRADVRGFNLLQISHSSEKSGLECAITYFQQRRIDGFIFPGFLPAGAELSIVGCPCVTLGLWQNRKEMTAVEIDAESGISEAIQHLHELGHRDLLYLGRRTSQNVFAEDRVMAFYKSAKAMGMAASKFFIEFDDGGDDTVDWYVEQYYRRISEDFVLPSSTTAILCYNDNMAHALCSVLRERQVRVPQDVSVIGFDDMYASFAIPPLTTISHMLPEMGAGAVDALIDLIAASKENRKPKGGIRYVKAKLVVRKSTGPVSKSR